jgi:RNA polymerase sigma-70 factor (ECF subfamily)
MGIAHLAGELHSIQVKNLKENLLLERLKADDQSALKILFDLYFKTLTHISFRLCRDTQVAEDVAQDVFISFWKKRNDITIEKAILPYLKRMTINKSLAHIRKEQRRNQLDDNLPSDDLYHTDVEESVLTQELQEQVAIAIEDLPTQCSHIFKLSRMEGMSYAEIASTLDISKKTVENQMGKALKKLRISLSQYLQSLFL